MARPRHSPDAFDGIADATRREILGLVGERPMRVGVIAEHFDSSQANISEHLGVLRDVGLVSMDKIGREHWYDLNPEGLIPIVGWLTEFSFWSRRLDRLGRVLADDGA